MGTDESRIDEFFESTFGSRPKKKGSAYELLVAAALKLVDANAEVKANQYILGAYSSEKYQIDVDVEAEKAVEAKDFTGRNRKVGRPEVTKLAGALQDLPHDSGVVASATGFTRPAKKFADSTKINPLGKPIDLYHIRPSIEEDEEGRIKSVCIEIIVLAVNRQKMKFEPILTKTGNETLKQLFKVGDSVQLVLERIHKSDGSLLITIFDLTSKIDRATTAIVDEGTWVPPEPAFIMIHDRLVEISGIKYFIPREIIKLEIVVGVKGRFQLLIKSEDGTIDKLLTDEDLKRVTFAEDGEIKITR